MCASNEQCHDAEYARHVLNTYEDGHGTFGGKRGRLTDVEPPKPGSRLLWFYPDELHPA